MKMNFFTIIFLGFSISNLNAQNNLSPFNQIEIKDTLNYSFFVSGHFYGSDKNSSGLPANTLLGNLDIINDSDASMLVCLGDLFKDINSNIPNYQRVLFNKLKVPLFNAVGNHDLSGTTYQDNFGATNFSFKIGNDVHIFLDTETSNGSLTELQLNLIRSASEGQSKLNNLFIYSHRTVWKEAYSEMDHIFQDNTQAMVNGNFKDEVLPLLRNISKATKVFWMSGSLGTAPASFFYHQDEEITYIATAIRELPRDAILKVDVVEGEVSFTTVSLTGQQLESLSNYNLDYWNTVNPDEPYNYKLTLYYFQQMLTHRYFWYGFLWTSFGFTLLWLVLRRKRKKAT